MTNRSKRRINLKTSHHAFFLSSQLCLPLFVIKIRIVLRRELLWGGECAKLYEQEWLSVWTKKIDAFRVFSLNPTVFQFHGYMARPQFSYFRIQQKHSIFSPFRHQAHLFCFISLLFHSPSVAFDTSKLTLHGPHKVTASPSSASFFAFYVPSAAPENLECDFWMCESRPWTRISLWWRSQFDA